MKSKNIGWKLVMSFISAVITYAIASSESTVGYSQESPIRRVTKISNDTDYTFGKTINKIYNSDLISVHKIEAVDALKIDYPSSYYESVVAILGSNLDSYHKVQSIKKLGALFKKN